MVGRARLLPSNLSDDHGRGSAGASPFRLGEPQRFFDIFVSEHAAGIDAAAEVAEFAERRIEWLDIGILQREVLAPMRSGGEKPRHAFGQEFCQTKEPVVGS